MFHSILIILLVFFFGFTGVQLARSSVFDIRAQSFKHEYNVVGGCMIKHNDRWIPLSNVRGNL